MKKYQTSICNFAALLLFFSILSTSNAQISSKIPSKSFRKGCLLVSISEGVTTAKYTTSTYNDGQTTKVNSQVITGERDPLIVEFGLTDRIGIGFCSGADIFRVNPSRFYGFNLQNSSDKIKATTSEFTFDLNYHVFTAPRTDASVFTSFGFFGIAFSGKNGDYNYKYNANGGMVRVGTKIRYYFYKRLGAFGMFSCYTGSACPKGEKGNNVGKNINTTVSGAALEIGLCYRFF